MMGCMKDGYGYGSGADIGPCFGLLSFVFFCFLLLSFVFFCFLLLSFAFFCFLLRHLPRRNKVGNEKSLTGKEEEARGSLFQKQFVFSDKEHFISVFFVFLNIE